MNKSVFLAAMESYGGSFVQALSKAMRAADPHNYKRLQEAFPELERQYGPESSFYCETEAAMETQALFR